MPSCAVGVLWYGVGAVVAVAVAVVATCYGCVIRVVLRCVLVVQEALTETMTDYTAPPPLSVAGVVALDCLSGVGVSSFIKSILTAVDKPSVFGELLATPQHWMRLLRKIDVHHSFASSAVTVSTTPAAAAHSSSTSTGPFSPGGGGATAAAAGAGGGASAPVAPPPPPIPQTLGDVGAESFWRQSVVSWVDLAAHAALLGFVGAQAEENLHRAACFLDALGVIVYRCGG